MKPNIFDRANAFIRNGESSLVNLLSALAPWGAPLAPAYMAYGGMTGKLGFAPWVALSVAGVIEILGLATIYTALQFWRHNRRYSKSERRMPVELAVSCFVFYLIVVLTTNVLLEIPGNHPATPVVARALLTLLSVPAGVTLAIRAQHTELLREIAARRAQPQVQPPQPEAQPAQPQVQPPQLRGTRRKVYDLATRNPDATAATIGQELHITRQAVDKHLAALAADGHIRRNGRVA